MTQGDFVLVYVIVPLVAALGWLIWRARRFLRDLAIYALVVAGLVLFLHVGNAAWSAWDWTLAKLTGQVDEVAPFCVDARRLRGGSACWT